MPKNKDALVRYRVINRCLKDYGYITKEKLIEACERALDIAPIGERTIAGDLHAMRYDRALGYFAPIAYSHSRKAYYYEDPDYSIDQIPLNEEEVRSLAFAATLLDQFRDLEIFSKFAGSIQKIIDAIHIHRAVNRHGPLDFIDFEKVPFVRGSHFLDPLIRAIRDKTVVHITYRSFHSEIAHEHNIHPYLLKEYRNRWYLVGYHEYFKEIRIYGLDRIEAIEERPDITYFEGDFSAAGYFRNTIGIFAPPEDPPEIVLRFRKEEAQYFITQPIHESQEIVEENEDSVTFSIRVHPTAELIQLILGWGSAVEVIKPTELKNQILRDLKAMVQHYE